MLCDGLSGAETTVGVGFLTAKRGRTICVQRELRYVR